MNLGIKEPAVHVSKESLKSPIVFGFEGRGGFLPPGRKYLPKLVLYTYLSVSNSLAIIAGE